MPKSKHKKKPTTKAGKRRKVGKVMGEFKRGTLRSSSGHKVTKRSQAQAIAMSESGQTKPKPKRKRKRKKKSTKRRKK